MRTERVASIILAGMVPNAAEAKHVTKHIEHMAYERCTSEVLRMPADAGERYIQQYSTLHMIVDFYTSDSSTHIVCDKRKGTKTTTDTDFMFQ
ncbi:MAG: hypothetical protein ACRYG4_08565 [Janthinobacterium lividum]